MRACWTLYLNLAFENPDSCKIQVIHLQYNQSESILVFYFYKEVLY
jgi:hypothetical protein